MGLHLPTTPCLLPSLLAHKLQLQLVKQDQFFPPPQQLTCLFFCLGNSCSHSTLLVLSHLSVLSIKNHFLRRWYPNPKCDPLAYAFIALKSFPFHPSCFVITHLQASAGQRSHLFALYSLPRNQHSIQHTECSQ